MTINPATFGGFLKVPAGIADNYVLLIDGTFISPVGLSPADSRIQLYGGGHLIQLASGQIVPLASLQPSQ